MMFEWEQYLRLARELAKRTNDEAALRSAISRAYYAVYGTARNHLEGERARSNRGLHKALWDQYRKSEASPEYREIGLLGDKLRKKRNMADYENTVEKLPKKVDHSLETAQQVLELLSSLESR